MTGKVIQPVTAKSDGHFLMRIETDPINPLPGQFVTLKINQTTDPLLRRPFSIFDYENGVLEIIFQVVGKGTEILSEYTGDTIDILGPLGRGFTLAEKSNVLLIGGGAGNAPLHYLARILGQKGCSITQIHGSRSKSVIYCQDRFCSLSDEVIFMTDDGSEGHKGYVTAMAEKVLSERKFDFIYACGPSRMLSSLVPVIKKSGTPCEFSLENYFGCGTGICYGCTIRTLEGNKRVCTDGPVFDIRILDFEMM
jgi:dihydroorotate dehydrogenase electron transfer subunit